MNLNNYKHSKGQINSIDFIVGLFIFILLLVFLLSLWAVSMRNIEKVVIMNKFESSAVSLSDLLLKTKGIPENWTSSYVYSVGLASSQNILSNSKLANFTDMLNQSYEPTKAIIGVDKEFYFYVETVEGNRLYQGGNFSSGELAVSITRFAMLNGVPVRLRVVVHD